MIKSVCFPSPRLSNICLVKLISLVPHLCLERKPCWKGLSMSFEAKKVMMLDTKLCEAILVSDIGL